MVWKLFLRTGKYCLRLYTESTYRYLKISLVWSGPWTITAWMIWIDMIFAGPYSSKADWRDIGNWTKTDSARCQEQQKQPKRQQQPGQPQTILAAPYRYTCPALSVQSHQIRANMPWCKRPRCIVGHLRFQHAPFFANGVATVIDVAKYWGLQFQGPGAHLTSSRGMRVGS